MGVNVYGWRSSGVNHVLIFELDPRNHLSEQHIMELAAVLGVVWTLSLLSFLYSASLSIPPYVNPLVLVCIMLVFLLNPFRIFRHEARFWLLRISVSSSSVWKNCKQKNTFFKSRKVKVRLAGGNLNSWLFSSGEWSLLHSRSSISPTSGWPISSIVS